MTEKMMKSAAPVRLWRTMVIAAIGLSAAALSPMSAASPPDARVIAAPPSFDLTDPARIAAGKKRFNKTCAGYCHGSEGVGGRTPDFKGRTDLPDEEAYKTIFYGRRTSDIMPPWGEAFSSDQIWELVAYLKFLGTQ
ncbi:MAG: c-type cytochrome [Methyloversatilis sp.]|jgi:mono/diheme cytochrome c family protein|nr:c-type cytochrome [Methyloversatilis sp.]MBP6195322.1 c-type cytochrome [Methyloversatilis sp.]MBP9118225.1 c-type cytochrome [Methyloversatilis sp.]